jgi:hypothetical protein
MKAGKTLKECDIDIKIALINYSIMLYIACSLSGYGYVLETGDEYVIVFIT